MSNRLRWLLTIGLSVVPLIGFWTYGLFDLDEGFYAAVVAEMNRRGEWITPYYMGQPWFEKPILLYWLAKPSVLVFGQSVGPRLPSVIATLCLYILCGLFLRKRVSGVAGRWSIAILASSLLIVGLGRMMMTDAPLTLLITGAFLSFYESLVGARSWRLVTALCLGLTVLDKGPVALPLFAALAIWTWIAEKPLRPAFRGYWLLGTLILVGTIGIWYVPAYLQNGHEFVQRFLIEQNLQRFGGGDEAHKVPLILWPLYYPVVLLVGMLPWSLFAWKPWVQSLKGESTPLERYLGRWALVVLVFFTISGTKLPHYILPAMPPLGMLLAIRFAERRTLSWTSVAAVTVAVSVIVNVAFIGYYKVGGFEELDSLATQINQMVNGRTLVVSYQLARVKDAPGLGINETSAPSLAFYLDPRVELIEIPKGQSASAGNALDSLSYALKSHQTDDVFVLTRPQRITPEQLRVLQARNLTLSPFAGSGDHFELYEHMPSK